MQKFFAECAAEGCGRVGTAEEVAELICFLASDAGADNKQHGVHNRRRAVHHQDLVVRETGRKKKC